MIDRYTQNGYVTDFLNFAVNSFCFAITTTLLLNLSMTDSQAEFNYQALVGTDGAEIFLADPMRLLEHSNDPTGWQHTAGAQREQVADIADVPMMNAIPNLLAYESPTTSAFYPISGFSENCSEVPKVAIRMPLENGQLPAP